MLVSPCWARITLLILDLLIFKIRKKIGKGEERRNKEGEGNKEMKRKIKREKSDGGRTCKKGNIERKTQKK